MRALVYDLSLWKYLLCKAAGPRVKRIFYGPGTCFEMRDVPSPERPADDWLVLRPRLAGFCGSDLSAIFFKMRPSMSALTLGAGGQAWIGPRVPARARQAGARR